MDEFKKPCQYCKKFFQAKRGLKNRKFCSHQCYSDNKLGKKHTWGYKISLKLKGIPKSESHIRNARRAMVKSMNPVKGKAHWNWKGDKVGYDALHDWVYRYKGSPQFCENCKITEDKVYHWANKTGKYLRELDDWIRLCPRCHSALDRSREFSYKKINKRKTGFATEL